MAYDIYSMSASEVRETLERVERRERERRTQQRHGSERRHLERMLAEVSPAEVGLTEIERKLAADKASARIPASAFQPKPVPELPHFTDVWGDAR